MLKVVCNYCNKNFGTRKSYYNRNKNKIFYCSVFCCAQKQITSIKKHCSQCNITIQIILSEFKKSKNGRFFCSRSCSAVYNNSHKTKGSRRSKLEIFLEKQLDQLFPNILIKYNDKKSINSELDIYIPSINLAFELNGIFHYEPIYGEEKLKQIQNNDIKKYLACLEHKIELIVINSSKLKCFKPKNAQKYLDIICNVINTKIASPPVIETGSCA